MQVCERFVVTSISVVREDQGPELEVTLAPAFNPAPFSAAQDVSHVHRGRAGPEPSLQTRRCTLPHADPGLAITCLALGSVPDPGTLPREFNETSGVRQSPPVIPVSLAPPELGTIAPCSEHCETLERKRLVPHPPVS